MKNIIPARLWNVLGTVIIFTGVLLVQPALIELLQHYSNQTPLIIGIILLGVGAYLFDVS